jgi:multidrug efflux pump subunit AcrA (membrane-fusion protein)
MKKLRAIVGSLLVILLVIAGLFYVRVSLRKASAPPQPGATPSLDDAPARVYGRVEPLGREVFLAPQQARRVTRVLVHEGQNVATGQPLCELEAEVERQELQVALSSVRELEARLDLILDELKRKESLNVSGPDVGQQALRVAVLRERELEARLDLILDELKRKEPLSRIGATPEWEYSQKSLEAELLRRQIATARAEAEIEFSQKTLEAEQLRRQIATAEAEVELKHRQLDTLILRSPIKGFLYTFDVRLGEHLTPQDYQRIVLGNPEMQVRLFLESFWIDKVRVGDRFLVRDAEIPRKIGIGKVVWISDYVGARDFRTEDSLERLDTKYAQAILQLEKAEKATPITLGKIVLCERQPVETKERNRDLNLK